MVYGFLKSLELLDCKGGMEMRVLVHGLVGTNWGGIEAFLLNMNEKMSENCVFDYIIEQDECQHENRIKNKGGNIYRVVSISKNTIKNSIQLWKLYKEKRNNHDVIYYNLSSMSWVLPEIMALIQGYRVVVHSHNSMLIDTNSTFLYRKANYINKWILSKMKLERLSCSRLASDFMFGKMESTVIYNGIDVSKYAFNLDVRTSIRDKYSLSDDIVFGCVGRIAYQKNPLFTLQVFYEFLKINNKAKLIMIGEGQMRGNVEQRIKELGIEDRVILTGNISNVMDYLNAMDVFLLPSQHEGLGIALIEAQANGLMCFTSSYVVPEEVRISDLLNFIPLDMGEEYWATSIREKLVSNKDISREDYNLIVKESNYNLEDAARNLELLLRKEK